MEKMKVYEALKRASSFLESCNCEKEIAHILLMHHTGWNRTRMLMNLQEDLDGAVLAAFQHHVRQAAQGTPVQHLTGREMFFGRLFSVSPDVLIPRPETEELIAHVITEMGTHLPHKACKIIDVGTGSGIIAVTLALELEQSRLLASDISESAIVKAEHNARYHGAGIDFFHGDLLMPFIEAGIRAPVIVSNPPYIPEGDKEKMKENVKDHEPDMALFAGRDGLNAYRRLAAQLPFVIQKPGIVAFEIGHNQGEAVRYLMRHALPAETSINVIRDINNNERIVLAKM